MNLRLDPDFVEAAVRRVAGTTRCGLAPEELRRFHADRERCYEPLDPDERDRAFYRLHLDRFQAWGLQDRLLAPLQTYPMLPPALVSLAFRQARSARDETSELYVGTDRQRNAVLALRTERFGPGAILEDFLHRELMHLHDMIDPGFDYTPGLGLDQTNPHRERVARQRYRLLWDVTVEGRLALAGRLAEPYRDRIQAAFHRGFGFWPDQKRSEIFDELWNNPAPTHARLAALAASARDPSDDGTPAPGSACPLCRFPTFDWADPNALTAEARAGIAVQFPLWTDPDGLCGRCAEIYGLAGKFAFPPTVVL